MAEQNTQAVVLQQPNGEKLQFELKITEVANDTTAILSFSLSVIIALILGCLATWLAYWYGRKSFKLTEMSFKTVIEQIKTSQQSAIDLNTKLFEQQKALQNNQLQYAFKTAEIDNLRTIISEYLTCLIDFNTSITMKVKSLEREILIQESIKYNLRVANYHQLIELFLDCENNVMHSDIKKKLKYVLDRLWDIRKELNNDYMKLDEEIIDFSMRVDSVKEALGNLLILEIRKLKGE